MIKLVGNQLLFIEQIQSSCAIIFSLRSSHVIVCCQRSLIAKTPIIAQFAKCMDICARLKIISVEKFFFSSAYK